MSLLTPEGILRQILTTYENEYATSLATVQSNWSSIEDIELEDFITRQIASDPSSLDKQWLLPALSATMGTIRESTETGTMQMMSTWYDMQTMIAYYFQHPDATILAKIISRHVEATLDLFKRYPGFGFQSGKSKIVPGTIQFIPSRVTPRGNVMAKGLMVQFNYRFLNYAG